MARWPLALFAAAAGFAAIALAQVPAAAQRGQDGIELYSQQHFGGERRFFTSDVVNLEGAGFNDAALSVRVVGYGSWQLCIDEGFLGRCVTVDRDEPDLNRLGIGSRVSSIRRIDTWGGGDPGWGAPSRPSRRGLVLFEGANLSGARFELREGTLNLANSGFNDRARSLVADGPWWVCADMNYNRCQIVEGEVRALSSLGLNNQISSARPVEPDEYPGYGGGEPPFGGGTEQPSARGRTAAFFAQPGFRGRALLACERGGYGRQCADRTADDFCRRQGFNRSQYFSIVPAGRNGEVIEDLLCVR
ncbi:MAG: beta/gamma crystallin-related protein [Caulobacterales bacterium]|jgi:hypothetical protein